MRLEHALGAVRFVVEAASAPVSVYVVDGHGEIVAAATMDGAAPDTRLNAQRKAYTAARSDATSTAELAVKAREDAAERASFDPFFTFFQEASPHSRTAAGSERWVSAASLVPTTTRWPGGPSRRRVSRRWARGLRLPSSSLKRLEEDHEEAHNRVLLAVLVAAVAAIPVFAATPKFTGTVGPGFTIGMAKKPTKAGKITLVVNDKSSSHNFRLKGPA